MIWGLRIWDRPWRLAGWLGLLIGAIIFLGASPTASAQTVRTQEQIARVLAVEKFTVADGAVSGELHNRSSNIVRDIQLFIRYTWLWDNEMKPGKEDPGTSTYYTLPKDIHAGGRLPFTFKPSPPLPDMSGGHFETSVSIAGYTEIIPQSQ